MHREKPWCKTLNVMEEHAELVVVYPIRVIRDAYAPIDRCPRKPIAKLHLGDRSVDLLGNSIIPLLNETEQETGRKCGTLLSLELPFPLTGIGMMDLCGRSNNIKRTDHLPFSLRSIDAQGDHFFVFSRESGKNINNILVIWRRVCAGPKEKTILRSIIYLNLFPVDEGGPRN